MDIANQSLQMSTMERKVLANRKDLVHWSHHGYQRLAQLVCTAILAESEKPQLRQNLCLRLCSILQQSGNSKLLQECQRKVQSVEALATTAQDNIAAWALLPTVDWDLFVKVALNGTTIASATDMHLVSSCLSHLSLESWESKVGPAIVLKLKAKPESVMDLVKGLLQALSPLLVAQSKLVIEELLPVVMKQLKSPKDSVRNPAMVILQSMGKSMTKACGDKVDGASSSLRTVVQALADTKTLTQIAQRQAVYVVLASIGRAIMETKIGLDETIITEVLTGIRTPLAKEAKTATEARQQGLDALMAWIVVGKRNGGGRGYDDALANLAAPIALKNGPDSQAVLGTFVQQVHPDLVESISLDLWKDEKFVKGLEGLIEAANKKHESASSIPQVEGLLAVYLSLLQAASSSKPKLSPAVEKVLAAASSSVEKTSFVFGVPTIKAVATNTVVAKILPQIIALYVKISSSMGTFKANLKASSSLCKAMASCITHPAPIGNQFASAGIASCIQTVLDYQSIAEPLVEALFGHVNQLSLDSEELRLSLNATRKAREEAMAATIKGKCSETGDHGGMDVNAVRRVAKKLMLRPLTAKALGMATILMHVGTSMRSTCKQRLSLEKNLTKDLKECLVSQWDSIDEIIPALADFIAENSGKVLLMAGDSTTSVSPAIHKGSLSLILTLGKIASQVSAESDEDSEDDMKPPIFAKRLCTEELAPRLRGQTTDLIPQIEALSAYEIDVYRTPLGSLCRPQAATKSMDDEKGGKGRRTEDEEWELQLKKELAKKKQSETGAENILSPEDKKLVAEQDKERGRIACLVETFHRVFSSVDSLAQSDIEVGNASLPILSEGVLTLAVSRCPAMQSIPGLKEKSFKTLTTLATCVYEIEETYSRMIASALVTCYRQPDKTDGPLVRQDSSKGLSISALPSPCESAATTIFEMDEFQEELSGASFAFLFPVVSAALKGPRTPPGCEGALRVLERHSILLAGEEKDRFVAPLRIDMVGSVLELLRHDRAQTFVDPTPYEALVACYQTDSDEESSSPPLTTAELAALLDERGAIGPHNCRVGSMIALAAIGSNHKKLLKANPLIENRIWLNCFEKDETIRKHARKAWGIIHDMPDLDETTKGRDLPPPSPLYAISLLPLLNNSDKTIAAAAAEAFAHGMAAHSNSVNRNIQKLCSSFIDSCPGCSADDKSSVSSSSLPSIPSPAPVIAPPKKPAGVPAALKKKTVQKSALEVAGIGQAKKQKKKSSSVAAALLKPKQERTLDQSMLESQFKLGPQKAPPEKDTPEKVGARLGILHALSALSSSNVDIDTESLKLLTGFLMAYGIADMDESVKNTSRDTLRDIVATYGAGDDAIAFLLPLLDKILKTGVTDDAILGELSKDKIPDDKDASNRRKEGAVVVLGSVALHLKGPENASKIDTTVDMLLDSLKTPNEDVQASVADCLAKLMKKGNTQERIEKLLDDMLQNCLNGQTSSIRRGGAQGVAAAVQGSGIAALKKYGIVTKLEEACASGTSTGKEGSLFAIELLCTRLGLLFEPYVIVLLPSLLKAFSDSSDHVRKAASQAVALIMSKLSAHGVKLVMPAVLTAFNDSAWRTKQASIHMLGSMCHLAPKQLAQALPKVVPKVIEAFADTHPKVKASAQEALDEITTVIRNPEISSLSPSLLKALTDPADYTLPALEALIGTEFLHAIDAPSLALIVPILHRGLRDRAATTKRYGALITGNICTMINDPRDFIPYLPTLIPDLQSSLLDPIPDVRSIAAKAFGSLTRGLGEDALPDLRPWLIDRLRSEEVSSAERSGAAQGLTEVLLACGNAIVESVIMDDILPLKNHSSASTREGVLWILTFLPPALGQGFTPMLDACLPALISGLSDENEEVRDIGMRAGRVIIRSHGRVHFNKILPILEKGMGDLDHRIRLSSLTLTGDLLSMIGGTTVLRTDGDTQDDIRKAEKAQAQLTLTLGIETRNRVLSEIYLARNDTAVAVRQTAVQVWKTIVSVTARTLRQILPVLVTRVVADLASGDIDKTEVAGKCLGDIVGKLGETVMPQIVPVLRDSLYDGDTFTRRGVCVGLSEVIGSSSKEQIIRYLDIIVKVVQDALCDDDESVRQMAAASFQKLHSLVGNRAMDEVVPALMVALESSGDDAVRLQRSLNGLTGILSFRSKELLPYIIPRLIQTPITTNHAKALASIAAVTGETIIFHTKPILLSLMNDLASPADGDKGREGSVRECFRSFCANAGEAGINGLIGEIAAKCTSDKAEMRREACWAMELVITERKELGDFYEQVPIVIRELISRLNDDNQDVLKAANSALNALSTHVPAEELVNHVEYMRNLIATMVSDARRRKGGVGDGEFLLPGFNMPKGLDPLLPIYQRGILYGVPSIREASAAGLGEVISLTGTKFLAGPLIIKMTGPLLRIVGDRNPGNVKIAILKTLGLILVKGGPALRAFVPQFQTTFVKALADPSRQVRVEAIHALGLLMPLSTRVDPLLKELVIGSQGKAAAASDSVGVVAVQTATLEALAVVLREGGTKAKLPESIPSALTASQELLEHADESVREAAAKVIAAACDILGLDSTLDVIEETIAGDASDSGDIRHGKACAIRRILSVDVAAELDENILSNLLKQSLKYMKDDKATVKDAGCVAIGAVIGRSKNPTVTLRGVEAELLAVMGNTKETLETHQALAKGLCLALTLAKSKDNVDFFGVTLLNACLKLAMSGVQRVQFAYNDVLYLALHVAEGQGGLDRYSGQAMFQDSKQMKSLYSKVLLKMKQITILND